MAGNKKSGRGKKPTNLKVLQGTYRADRDGDLKDQLQFPSYVPNAPDHLSKEGLVEWGRISTILYEAGLLTKIDRAALAAYCQSYGRWVEAEYHLKDTGLVIQTTNGNVIQNPLVGISNQAMEHMRKFLTEFGMTPASRAKVPKPKGNGSEEELEFDKLG